VVFETLVVEAMELPKSRGVVSGVLAPCEQSIAAPGD